MARICLINPRFPASFWGLNHGLPLLGKKSNMPVLALPVLAGLTPPEHEVVLIDENIQEIDFDALESFDIVGLTGMTVQRDRMREILVELQTAGSSPSSAAPGSAWPRTGSTAWSTSSSSARPRRPGRRFLEDWQRGEHASALRAGREDRHDQGPAAAVRPGPVPRVRDGLRPDLARAARSSASSATSSSSSAGRPRIKTPEQVVAEIDAQHRLGARVIFLVDDNFIGNKKAAKVILRAIIAWQRQARLPAGLLHRGVARPGRGRRADAAHGRGRPGRRLHRHREPRRGGPPRDQEVPERPRAASSSGSTRSRPPGWRSTPA